MPSKFKKIPVKFNVERGYTDKYPMRYITRRHLNHYTLKRFLPHTHSDGARAIKGFKLTQRYSNSEHVVV